VEFAQLLDSLQRARRIHLRSTGAWRARPRSSGPRGTRRSSASPTSG
jgi:hypothetical protein